LEEGLYSIEEEIRARKLLVKVYLFSDNEEAAEEALVDLLLTDKEHQLTPEDPAELYFLYSKYKTEPILRVSAKFGGNKTYITRLQEFNSSQIEKKYNPNAGSGLNVWAELLAERHIGKGIELAAGTQLRIARYDVEGELIANDLTYQVSNISTALRFPLLVRYNFGYDAKVENSNARKTLTPYIFLGGSLDLTLNSRYEDTSRSGGTAVTLDDESSSLSDLNQVEKQNASIFLGAGVKFRVGRARVNFLTLEARYDNSLFNYINPDGRWLNQSVGFGITYIEDDLTINTASFSIGYIHSFYIPRKRKQFR